MNVADDGLPELDGIQIAESSLSWFGGVKKEEWIDTDAMMDILGEF